MEGLLSLPALLREIEAETISPLGPVDMQANQSEAEQECSGRGECAAGETDMIDQTNTNEEVGCIFCGVIGNEHICGPLKPATINGIPVLIHHLCALWAPQVYQQEGSDIYLNLEEEYRRAEDCVCTACGYTGAAICCTDPGCKCSYHLPCAIQTPNVFLDVEAFELWCPMHADNDDDDGDDSGDYGSVHVSSRGRVRTSAASSRRQRPSSNEGLRGRTDWQKRDDFTWYKVVPPWWAEHKTVHFAGKVYKELFRSAGSVVIVDSSGNERLCLIQMESRNDHRQQYTLRGNFTDFWDACGIQAGDTLCFRLCPVTAKVTILQYTPSALAHGVAEQGSALSQPALTDTASVRARHEGSVDLATRGVSQQGSHPNRWMELNDGWCIKTVYKSTIAHQQCPIAGWLFKKLYSRLPLESDKALMLDPDLNQEYKFDVNFIGAANVHYITGRNFGAWMRESGLRAQEQIRVKKDGSRVLIQRVPSDMKVHVDFSKAGKSCTLTRAYIVHNHSYLSGGVTSNTQIEDCCTVPNSQEDQMEALDSLAAAAGLAAVHGTPAIAAALGVSPIGAGGMTLRSSQQTNRMDRTALSGELQPQTSIGGGQDGQTFSEQDWQPTPAAHMQLYQSLLEMVSRHDWEPKDQDLLLKFKGRFGRLDEVGREITFMNVRDNQADKDKLRTVISAVAG